jgi:hypothetical protein
MVRVDSGSRVDEPEPPRFGLKMRALNPDLEPARFGPGPR